MIGLSPFRDPLGVQLWRWLREWVGLVVTGVVILIACVLLGWLDLTLLRVKVEMAKELVK